MLDISDILGQDHAIAPLLNAFRTDHLPHALLLTGPVGVGKGTLARALGKLFLCESPRDSAACNQCSACRMIGSDTHPDFHLIYRQLIRLEKSKAKARDLPVDVIREFVVKPAGLRTFMGRGKVFIIEEAETMNTQAQNALLKTLEEPAGRTLIILLTDQPQALLSTVRSRSQLIKLLPLPESVVVQQLVKRQIDRQQATEAARLASGSLGLAIKWIEDGIVTGGLSWLALLDTIIAGQPADDLPDMLKKSVEAYAERQLQIDPAASKDQASKEGLAIYLRLASEHLRKQMQMTDDDALLDALCTAIETIASADVNIDANVTVSLVYQQIVVGLEGAFAGSI